MNQYQPVSQQNSSQQAHPLQEENYHQLQISQGAEVQNYENPQILRQSQLKHLDNQMNVLQKDIHDNNIEIRNLNNKIVKSDFEHAKLKKLFEKELKLKQKRMEFQSILRTHQYLKQQTLNNKFKQSQIKHSLGHEYQQITEQKKRVQKQQKERQKQLQANMIFYNQQAIKQERQKKRQFMEQQKRQVQQQLRQKQYLRQLQKQQKEKEKNQYNQILNHRSQLQTQKDHVYRQYYNHFTQEQEKLQTIYKNKAMEAEAKKQKQRHENEKKQFETFQIRIARENQQKLKKLTQERDQLRNFLQAQIEENNMRKSRQREEERRYQSQVKTYQMNLSSYQIMEKQRKKQLQKKYQTQLSTQIQLKNRMAQQNIEDAFRTSSIGYTPKIQNGQFSERKTHNPVTNPIDFKIGITNPYLIKQYENTKEKYMGDHNLKLRNLAMIGNHSLMSARH